MLVDWLPRFWVDGGFPEHPQGGDVSIPLTQDPALRGFVVNDRRGLLSDGGLFSLGASGSQDFLWSASLHFYADAALLLGHL